MGPQIRQVGQSARTRLACRRNWPIAHSRATRGTFESPTVDLITTATGDVVVRAEAKPDPLSPRRQEMLDKLIRRDHRFHERRAQRYRAKPAAAASQAARR